MVKTWIDAFSAKLELNYFLQDSYPIPWKHIKGRTVSEMLPLFQHFQHRKKIAPTRSLWRLLPVVSLPLSIHKDNDYMAWIIDMDKADWLVRERH